MTDPTKAPAVLVAGAGPVGLTVAHELARRGVAVRIVERAKGPAATSRATATHARTLEIFDQMGVLPRLLHRGQRVVHFSLHMRGRRLVRFDTNYADLPTRFPFSLMVDQVITEEVLRQSLAELGVPVEWDTELQRFEPSEDGVSVSLGHGDGSVEQLDVPWLVGADGARSTVRKQLGLRLLGDTTQTWMNADVVIDADLQRDSNHLLHTGKGTILLVPFPDPGKWRAVDTVDVSDAEDWELVRARLARKISLALRRPVEVATPTWVSVFTVQQRMIQQMRVGRCFVAGDAAHVHSPASGQGMNTGIQDGYNLAWKLADVVRGYAAEELLDSYSAERVPIGKTLLGSTRTATALVALRTALAPVLIPVGLGLLNRLKPVKRKIEGKIIRGFCGLALDYAGSPLSGDSAAERGALPSGHRVGCTSGMERDHTGWGELVAQLRDPRWTLLAFTDGTGSRRLLEELDARYGDAVALRTVAPVGVDGAGPNPLADADGALRRALGPRSGSYALIRPDGYLAGTGPLEDLERTTALLRGFGLVNGREVAQADRGTP
ncbi:FAD-dependent oxidoreductase [Micromonospora sp. NPDC050200]|uniref:FAD-dependent oxidoreductase n=1 Tax=Micromonospora sp. NPDC050200 TaxID=3155664 RepID=UPI0033FFC7DE